MCAAMVDNAFRTIDSTDYIDAAREALDDAMETVDLYVDSELKIFSTAFEEAGSGLSGVNATLNRGASL